VSGEAGQTGVGTLCPGRGHGLVRLRHGTGRLRHHLRRPGLKQQRHGDVSTAIDALGHDRQALDADRASGPADIHMAAPGDGQTTQATNAGQVQITGDCGTTCSHAARKGDAHRRKARRAKARAEGSAADVG
jgi:hypothetical protein